MILITVKFPIREDRLERWGELSHAYAESVSAEPGNGFFEFAESVLEPRTFVCIEGFLDGAAGEAHMQQPHVERFMAEMPDSSRPSRRSSTSTRSPASLRWARSSHAPPDPLAAHTERV